MALTAAEKADQLVAVSNSLRFVPPNAEWTDYDTSKSSLWRLWRVSFPRPRRRQLMRVFKSLLMVWTLLIGGLYDNKVFGSLSNLGIMSVYFMPAGPPLKIFVTGVAGFIGLLFGFLLMYLGCLWVALYNRSGGTDPYIRALLVELWLIFVTWTASSIQFKYVNEPIGGVAFFCLAVMITLVEAVDAFITLDHVPVEALLKGAYPIAIVQAFCVAVAVFIFPESNSEATRESALQATRSIRTAMMYESAEANNVATVITNLEEKESDGSADDITKSNTASSPYISEHRAFLYGRMHNDIASLSADSHGCLLDIGFYRDVPARMLLVARAIRTFSRHVQHGVRSQALVKTLEAVHDALIVEKKWYRPSFWNYSTDEPFSRGTNVSELLAEVRIELGKERDVVLSRSDHISTVGRREFDAFVLSMALEDADKLAEAVQNLQASRNTGAKFYYFGRPGKEALPPAPKKTKAEKLPKPARKWKPGVFAFDVLYVCQSSLSSDAARFGFKRALAFFLCSVWALLPSTAEYYVMYNIHWVLFSVVLLLTPTLGAGVIKSGFRLLATGTAILWAYFAWLASGAKGADTETSIHVALAFYAPLSIVGYYAAHVFPRPYLGTMFILCYVVIALGSKPELIATFGGQRAIWLLVSVVGVFFFQIVVFPILASTDSRVGLGNILYGVGRTIRSVETGADPEELASQLTSLQTRLTALRLGSLRDAAGEPDLDRPWNLRIAEAISASMQRLIIFLGGLVDYRALAGPPPRWFDELVDETFWKIHTLAMALVTKKPLPRLPKLEMNKFGEDALGIAQGPRRLMVAGGGAAFQEMLAELDVLEELIGRMYGKEVVAGEVNESMVDGTWALWPDNGKVAVLERRRVRAVDQGPLDL